MADLAEAVRVHDPLPRQDGPARAALYRWLAGAFAAAPDAATIEAWRALPLRTALAALAGDAPAGLDRIATAVETETPDALATRLGIAFGRLFLGIGGPSTVAPYESAVRGSRLAGTAAAEMAALLAARGLSVAHDFADHVSDELVLAARLLAEEDGEAGDLVRRLAGWLPAFAAACRRADPAGFYAGLADFAAFVVVNDARRNR